MFRNISALTTSLVLMLVAAHCQATSTCQDNDLVIQAVTSQIGLPFSKCAELAAFCNLSMSANQIPLTLLDTINYDADKLATIKTEAQKLKSRGDFTVGNVISLACPKSCNQPCDADKKATPAPSPARKCTDHPKVLKAVTKRMGFGQFEKCTDVAGFCQMKFDASMVPPSVMDTVEYEDQEAIDHIRQAAHHYHAHGEYTVGNLIGLVCPATCGTPCNPAPQVDTSGLFDEQGRVKKLSRGEILDGLKGIENHPALLRGVSGFARKRSLRGAQGHANINGDGYIR